VQQILVDLSDPQKKSLLLNHVRSLEGQHKVSITKYYKKRSLDQNAYFHSQVVGTFADWCRGEGNSWTDEQAKSHLKDRFLSLEWTDERTGEIMRSVRDTRDLTTVEFSEFTEKCCAWIAEFCGVYVPPPDPFYETRSKK
jgi:hypothetical protein